MSLRSVLLIVCTWIACLPGPVDRLSAAQKTVKDYGAIGDGITDDSAAIQAALNADNSVFLPPGVYRLGSRLTIARSQMSLIGAGPASTSLLIDEALKGGCLFVNGPSTLEDIEIRGLKIDGSKNPAQLIGMQILNARRVRLSQLTALDLSGLVHLEGVENFQIHDIAGSNLIEFISMNTIRHGTISDIRVVGVDEGFDFFNCEDVAVSGAVLSAREPTVIKPAEWAVAVDLSSSRRISITHCEFSGHHYSIKLKHDTEKVRGRPPVEDILISNCQLSDYKSAGIFFQVVEGRGCRVQNCEIRSTRAGSTGLYGFLPEKCQLSDLVIADCSIDAVVHGIRLNRYEDLEIRGCRIRSKESHGVNLQSCAHPNISSCRIHSPSDIAIMLADVDQPVVEDCYIAGVAGIWATNCSRPAVRGNHIPSALGRGITIEWTTDRGLDAFNRIAGFVVDENTISNWGSASAGNPAIALAFARTATGAYNAGSISGNRMIMSEDGKAMGQCGIAIDKGGLEALDWLKVDSNLAYGTYALLQGGESLGPNCTQANNSHKLNLP